MGWFDHRHWVHWTAAAFIVGCIVGRVFTFYVPGLTGALGSFVACFCAGMVLGIIKDVFDP